MHNLLRLKSEAEADTLDPAPVTTTFSAASVAESPDEIQRAFRRLIALFESKQEPMQGFVVRGLACVDPEAMATRGWLQVREETQALGVTLYEPAGSLLEELHERAEARWEGA